MGVQHSPVIDREPVEVPPPAPSPRPMSPEIAAWIDNWCAEEGISHRPWWKRLRG
jgi:hypothetical protein